MRLLRAAFITAVLALSGCAAGQVLNGVSTAVDLAEGDDASHAAPRNTLRISARQCIREDGALIDAVHDGGPAQRAGLARGDVIRAVNGVRVTRRDDLTSVLNDHQPGDTVRLRVSRGSADFEAVAILDPPTSASAGSPRDRATGGCVEALGSRS